METTRCDHIPQICPVSPGACVVCLSKSVDNINLSQPVNPYAPLKPDWLYSQADASFQNFPKDHDLVLEQRRRAEYEERQKVYLERERHHQQGWFGYPLPTSAQPFNPRSTDSFYKLPGPAIGPKHTPFHEEGNIGIPPYISHNNNGQDAFRPTTIKQSQSAEQEIDYHTTKWPFVQQSQSVGEKSHARTSKSPPIRDAKFKFGSLGTPYEFPWNSLSPPPNSPDTSKPAQYPLGTLVVEKEPAESEDPEPLKQGYTFVGYPTRTSDDLDPILTFTAPEDENQAAQAPADDSWIVI